ncbi:hypothetical protein ACFE04_007126 [Oxalis oulophora]
MGNHLSCALPCTRRKSAKVILPNGEIRRLNAPIEAAEIMFELPNSFLVNSRSLKIGRKFSVLNADQELELANVYVMFPMNRRNSLITEDDVEQLTLIMTNSLARRGKSRESLTKSSKVWKSKEDKVVVPKIKLDWFEEYCTPELEYTMSMSRSRKPLLETIIESEEEPYY